MIDLKLFKNIIAEGRHNSDLLDSYSPNQFKTKERLIGHVRDWDIVNEQSEITILGGWYGSILIPAFKEAKRISLIDLDKNAVSIGKQRLFSHYKNVDWITSDVFNEKRYGFVCQELMKLGNFGVFLRKMRGDISNPSTIYR